MFHLTAPSPQAACRLAVLLIVLQTGLIMILASPVTFPLLSNLQVSVTLVLLLCLLYRQKKPDRAVGTSFLIGTLGAAGMVAGGLFDRVNLQGCSCASLLSFSTLGMVVFCALGCGLFSAREDTRLACLCHITVSVAFMLGGMVLAEWLICSSLSIYFGTLGGQYWSMLGGMFLGTLLAERMLSNPILQRRKNHLPET